MTVGLEWTRVGMSRLHSSSLGPAPLRPGIEPHHAHGTRICHLQWSEDGQGLARAELRMQNEIGRNGSAIWISKMIRQLFNRDFRLLQNGRQGFRFDFTGHWHTGMQRSFDIMPVRTGLADKLKTEPF